MDDVGKIDREDAPEGYEAVKTRGFSCALCAFLTTSDLDCGRPLNSPSCSAAHRKDRCNVIFTRKEAK